MLRASLGLEHWTTSFNLSLTLSWQLFKYISVPLLAVTSHSEMSYCAHERKLKLVSFPFIIGMTVAGILRRTALDVSPLLKSIIPTFRATLKNKKRNPTFSLASSNPLKVNFFFFFFQYILGF